MSFWRVHHYTILHKRRTGVVLFAIFGYFLLSHLFHLDSDIFKDFKIIGAKYSGNNFNKAEASDGDAVKCKTLSVDDKESSPRTNIVFLKTHKTGGSTLQNIFLRFADHRNLTIALSRRGHVLGYPRTFTKAFQEGILFYSNKWVYDMVTHHTVYDKNMKNYLANDAVFVSILRDPVTTLESYFRYFELEKRIKTSMKFSRQDPLEYFLDVSLRTNQDFRNLKLRNQQLFDFGLKYEDITNKYRINETIREVENSFHLIMIAEYFDESLILLKHLLNWKIEDLIYLKQNVRVDKLKSPISKELRKKINIYNEGDWLLYNHFNKTFWKKVNQFCPGSFEKELQKFRDLNKHWTRYCVTGYEHRDNIKSKHQAGFKMSYGFKQRSATKLDPSCIALTTAEIPYSNHFMNKLLRSGQLLKERPHCKSNLNIEKGATSEANQKA